MSLTRAQLVKWGNSQAVRIPKTVLKQARLKEGEELEILAEEGRLTLQAANRRLTLESLVAGITPENQHKELDWGPPVGKEVW
jgi:antitoxin MazE